MGIKIGLVGKAGTGKDTVADYLMAVYGFKKFAFAYRLKEIDYELFGPTEGKDRKRLQEFGQFCRTIDPDTWVRQLHKQIKDYHGNIVVTDIRQPNEYQYCIDNGFIIVKIVCDDEIRTQRMIDRGDIFKPEDLQHETERFIDQFDFDYRVDNNGTFSDLANQTDYIIRDIQALANK